MKRFEFSLSKLQDYKEQMLESEKNTLGILRKELNDLHFALEELHKLIDLKSDELAYIMISGVTSADFAARKRFITLKQQEGHETRRAIAMKEQEVEVQLQVVVEATKEVNTLEKLEERQLEEYRYAEMKEEELFIEEFVSNQRSRARIAL
jgi:flagellar FliJ protein